MAAAPLEPEGVPASFELGIDIARAKAASEESELRWDHGGLRSVWSDAGRRDAFSGAVSSAPTTPIWQHVADPRASLSFFFLQIYHCLCFAGALCTLLAAFLSALISCVVAYYSEWESLGAEGSSTSFDGLVLIVLSSIALLIEVVFLSEIATSVCTCAFRLSWDMLFQREVFLEMRRTLTDHILQVDDDCDWGRNMDLSLQGFIYAALDGFPLLYAMTAPTASTEIGIVEFMVRLFDGSIFGAALVAGLWFFLMVIAKYCEWFRFWVMDEHPIVSDEDECHIEQHMFSESPPDPDGDRIRSAASAPPTIQLTRVDTARKVATDEEEENGGLSNNGASASSSSLATPARSRAWSARSQATNLVSKRSRYSTARQLRFGVGGRNREEVARRNLCFRLCALIDMYWRLPRRACIARAAPWMAIPVGVLLIFEAQALWASPYLLETLIATCMLLGVLSTYFGPNPKWLKLEPIDNDFARLAARLLARIPFAMAVGRLKTFIQIQHARLRVEFARRVALLALCHFFFCLRGTLNLSWYHVLMSMCFAAVCVIRMFAYYIDAVHEQLWIMELMGCCFSSVVPIVWSICKALYFHVSMWDNVRLPVLLVMCHFGMPGGKFVRRGRAFKRAEGLLIAGSFYTTVLVLMSLCLGLGFSDMKRRTQVVGRSTCIGRSNHCRWVAPKTLPEPYPFCDFRAWDTNLSLLDFGLLSSLAYSDPGSVRADLEEWFPGWQLLCYNLHMQEDNMKDPRCLGRRPPEAVRRSDWTSFMEFVPPDGSFTVIAVRGTQVPIEVLVDINIWLTTLLIQALEFFGPRIVYSNTQYWTFKAIEFARKIYPYDQMLNQFQLLNELSEQRKGRRVYMTGHSLGGGIALLASLHRSSDPIPPRAVTFCSPSTYYTAKLLGMSDTTTKGDELPNDSLQMLRAVQIKPAHDPVSGTDAPVGAVMPLLCRAQAKRKCHTLVQTMCELIATCGDSGRGIKYRVRGEKCAEVYKITNR